jgi:16S rRNA (guanine527-N7)-methyltransferase
LTSQPPSSRSSTKKQDTETGVSGGNNALWRVPEWFPKLDAPLKEQLGLYHSELLKFNIRLNLVSRNTEREADEIHFADCILAGLALAKVKFDKPVYDLGSGNGFPGLVLALMRPEASFLLVESDSRKCEFLKHVIAVLKIRNCEVLNVRLETLKGTQMSLAVSRGFANISKSLLAVNKLFVKGGQFYHLKGSNWGREIAEIPTQIISLWSPELVEEYSLPDTQARRSVVCTTRN